MMSNHITQLRKKSGFKYVGTAAEKLGISKSMLYQIEGFYKKPSSDLGIKMAEEFNCSLEDIFLPFNTTNSDKN